MLENVLRFVATIEGKASHWILENGTSIEQAEKMALQMIQYLGQMKVQQNLVKQAQESSKTEPIPEQQKQE